MSTVKRQKKVPQRKCIVCGVRDEKKALIRIVKNKEGDIFVDPTWKANGRGAYICNDIACLEKAVKTSALDRAFKMKVPESAYEDIKREIQKIDE